MQSDQMNVVAINVATTGVGPSARVVEIAVAFPSEATWVSRVRPPSDTPFDARASEENGIEADDLLIAPTFAEIVGEFAHIVEGGLAFFWDLNHFLRDCLVAELDRVGYAPPWSRAVDLEGVVSRQIPHGAGRLSLSRACEQEGFGPLLDNSSGTRAELTLALAFNWANRPAAGVAPGPVFDEPERHIREFALSADAERWEQGHPHGTRDDWHRVLMLELARREGPERESLTERIEIAREAGDLKEGSSYHAAKDEWSHNEARIRQLRAALEPSYEAQFETSDEPRIGPGMLITVCFISLGLQETLCLATRKTSALRRLRSIRLPRLSD